MATNHSKPTLSEFFGKFFEATDRYINAQDKRKNYGKFPETKSSEKETTSLAVNVGAFSNKSKSKKSDNPFIDCPLCDKNFNHAVNKCPSFSSASSKVNVLESARGCTACANLDHIKSSCKFRFKKPCVHCSGWHFSFL